MLSRMIRRRLGSALKGRQVRGAQQKRWITPAPKPGDGPLMSRRADRELPCKCSLTFFTEGIANKGSHRVRLLPLGPHPPHLPRYRRRLLRRHLQLPKDVLSDNSEHPLRATHMSASARHPRRRHLLQAPDPLDSRHDEPDAGQDRRLVQRQGHEGHGDDEVCE